MTQLNLTRTQFCVCANLRMASRATTHLYEEILKPAGLRATQFTLLVAISLAEPVTITDLARLLVMDRTTLTRNLKPLEKQDLIKSLSGEDRRTRVVMLTDQGQETLKEALPLWEKAQQQVVEALGPEKFNQLLANVSEIVSLVHQN